MTEVSAWLVIEMHSTDNWRPYTPKITKVRQTRPTNEMAVKVTLDIPDHVLQPRVDALVEAGMLALTIEESDEETT